MGRETGSRPGQIFCPGLSLFQTPRNGVPGGRRHLPLTRNSPKCGGLPTLRHTGYSRANSCGSVATQIPVNLALGTSVKRWTGCCDGKFSQVRTFAGPCDRSFPGVRTSAGCRDRNFPVLPTFAEGCDGNFRGVRTCAGPWAGNFPRVRTSAEPRDGNFSSVPTFAGCSDELFSCLQTCAELAYFPYSGGRRRRREDTGCRELSPAPARDVSTAHDSAGAAVDSPRRR